MLVLEDQHKKSSPRKMGIKEEKGKKSGTRKRGGTEQILHQHKSLPLVLELHKISFSQNIICASPRCRNLARARIRAVHCPPGMLALLFPLGAGGLGPDLAGQKGHTRDCEATALERVAEKSKRRLSARRATGAGDS